MNPLFSSTGDFIQSPHLLKSALFCRNSYESGATILTKVQNSFNNILPFEQLSYRRCALARGHCAVAVQALVQAESHNIRALQSFCSPSDAGSISVFLLLITAFFQDLRPVFFESSRAARKFDSDPAAWLLALLFSASMMLQILLCIISHLNTLCF